LLTFIGFPQGFDMILGQWREMGSDPFFFPVSAIDLTLDLFQHVDGMFSAAFFGYSVSIQIKRTSKHSHGDVFETDTATSAQAFPGCRDPIEKARIVLERASPRLAQARERFRTSF
jgi:hypothetical protein